MNRVKFARNDVYDFLMSFEDKTVARITGSLELLDKIGSFLRPPKSKMISKNLYELRILGKPSLRIFYTFYKESIFVLHAYVKKTQKISQKELNKALSILKYLQ